jgi:Lipid A core - O-antigen ligase and related enzymes
MHEGRSQLDSEVQISKPVQRKNIFIIFFYTFLISLAFSTAIADLLAYVMLFIVLKKIIQKEIKLENNIIMLSVLLLMGAYILSFLFNIAKSTNSLKTAQVLFSYMAPLLFYIIISSLKFSERQIRNSLLIIAFSSCAAFIFFFFANHPPYSFSHRLNFFNHPNQAALFIAVYCIILFSSLAIKQKRSIQIGKLVMLFIGLAVLTFTYTRSAWVGLFAAIALLCMLTKNRNLIAIFLILMILFGSVFIFSPDLSGRFDSIFHLHHQSNTSRLTIWSTALEIFHKQQWFEFGPNKLTGIGPGYFKKYFRAAHPNYFEVVPHPHNDLLQALTENGLLGLLSFLFFICILYYQAFKSWRHASTDLEKFLANIMIGFLVVCSVHGLVDLTNSKRVSMYLLMVMLVFLRQNHSKDSCKTALC